jgi:hypothetical protein
LSVLTIQAPTQRRRDPRRVDLPIGGSATFGSCNCGACDLDLPVPAHPPVLFRGEVLAGPDRWRLTNLGDMVPLRVTEVDSGRRTVLWPGEEAPFDHDMASVATTTDDAAGITVFFTAEPAPASRRRSCPAIRTGRPAEGPRLDPAARYFAVLEVLCASVLAGTPATPTSADIADRLGLTSRAVDAHVDYLVDKLAIAAPPVRDTGWKRRALVRHVSRRPAMMDLLRTAGRPR